MREVYCGFRWLQFDELTVVIISAVYTKQITEER